MKNSMYFSESGITSTHAAFIKNVCKELVQQDQTKLDNISVINSSVSLIGSDSIPVTTSVGVDKLDFVSKSINDVAKAFSLSAWLGEAIKAKDEMLRENDRLTPDEYMKLKGIKRPEFPASVELLDEEDVIMEMSISKRCEYLTLEARAAQIGKLIHPNGSLAQARKKALNIKENPVITSGSGRDMTVTSREVSVPMEELEQLFFDLQNEHRKAQSELNRIKADIKKKVDDTNLESQQTHQKAYFAYESEMKKITDARAEYIIKERQRISALKIAIPHELKEFYNLVDSMGK